MGIPIVRAVTDNAIIVGGDGGGSVNRVRFQVSGTWAGPLLTKGFMAGGEAVSGIAAPLASAAVELEYTEGNDPTPILPSTSAITANGIYTVLLDGLSLVLDWTRTSGTIRIDVLPLRG